jgi:hypothetical protein
MYTEIITTFKYLPIDKKIIDKLKQVDIICINLKSKNSLPI